MSPAAALLLALAGEQTRLRLSYGAPPECPSEAAFFAALLARTDRVRRAAQGEAALDVTVRVSRTDHGFRGELRETEGNTVSAARSVDGETCAEVVEALSLTVALSVDPDAHAAEPKAGPPTTHVAATPGPACVAPVPAATQAQTELELGLAALATEVLVSDLSLGAALSGTVLRNTSMSTSASLQVSVLWANTGALFEPTTHRARFTAVMLEACPVRFRSRSLELAPCASGAAGVLEATGRGLAEVATVDRGWWSAGLDAQLSVVLGGGLRAEAALGASVPFWRRRFYTTEQERVITETPVLSSLLKLGLGFRF